MDLFVLDKFLINILGTLTAEKLFKLSLIGLGLTTVICNKKVKK